MSERELRLEKIRKRLNNCETPPWIDPRTQSDIKTEKEIAKVEKIRAMDQKMTDD
jgi:hypothetical protein